VQANEVDLARTPLVLGPALGFDPATQRFTGAMSPLANAHLARIYPPPSVLQGV